MKSILIKNLLSKFFAFFLVLIIASCSSLTPYKVPILQGNILDEDDTFETKCNKAMVGLEKLQSLKNLDTPSSKDIDNDLLDFDEARLKLIIQRHLKYTKSEKARLILDDWNKYLNLFYKITPFDFKRALNERKQKLKEDNKVPNRIAGE